MPIKSENAQIVRDEPGKKADEGTRWTFANETEAAKQSSEFAEELSKAPKALKDKIEAASNALANLKGLGA